MSNMLLYLKIIGTQPIGTLLDPKMAIIQGIFTLLWVIAFGLYLKTFLKLGKIDMLSPVEYYRFNMSIIGMVMAVILMLFWAIHESLLLSLLMILIKIVSEIDANKL